MAKTKKIKVASDVIHRFILDNPNAYTAKEVAGILGASTASVATTSVHYGISNLLKGRKDAMNDKRNAIIKFISENPGAYTAVEVAEKFGTTKGSVLKMSKNAGVFLNLKKLETQRKTRIDYVSKEDVTRITEFIKANRGKYKRDEIVELLNVPKYHVDAVISFNNLHRFVAGKPVQSRSVISKISEAKYRIICDFIKANYKKYTPEEASRILSLSIAEINAVAKDAKLTGLKNKSKKREQTRKFVRNKIEKLLKIGVTNTEIAKIAGVSQPYVSKIAKELGIQKPTVEDVVKMHNAGLKTREIVEKTGYSRVTIYNYLKKHNESHALS